MDQSERAVAPRRSCVDSIDDALRPMPYLELQTMMDVKGKYRAPSRVDQQRQLPSRACTATSVNPKF
jgi:hypothetical protein